MIVLGNPEGRKGLLYVYFSIIFLLHSLKWEVLAKGFEQIKAQEENKNKIKTTKKIII